MTYNTGNPIGSTDARDRSDNSENLDLAVNSLSQTFVDRLGVTRDTLEGIYQKSAYYRAGTFDAGYTLTNNRQTLAYGNVEYSWSGAFPKVVPAGSTPATSGGVGAGAWSDKTDLMLRTELESDGSTINDIASIKKVIASSSGLASIGLPNNTTLMQYFSGGTYIDPAMSPFNYLQTDDLATRTASLQAAFEVANTTKRPIRLCGYYYVDTILLESHTEYTIEGNGAIVGMGSEEYILGIKNCTALKGGLGVTVTSGTKLHDVGIKVWGDGVVDGNLKTCSLHTLAFNVTNTRCAWQFGDLACPDNLMSECVVYGGHTYNVREVGRIIGSQAVIEFNGYQSIVAGTQAGTAVPFTVVGGVLHINGGELQMPGITDGYTVVLRPIDSPNFDNRYGSCFINGTAVESASLWMLAYNPSSVPSVKAGSGKFVMDNCSGFANFSGDNLQSGSDFSGEVIITDTCSFHRTSAKPANTYVSGIFGGKSKISDTAFDANFNKGLQYYRPNNQIPKYTLRQILKATNLNGQSFPLSANTTMVFKSLDSTGENAFYYSAYNPNNGVFTVPVGGLKNVCVHLEFSTIAARPNSEVVVLIDGSVVGGICGIPNKYICHDFAVGDLVAGQTVSIRLANLDAAFTAGSTYADKVVFFARTE